MRVNFNGVIEGSVTIRKGETEAQAIARAESEICAILSRSAKRLGKYKDVGPNVGLEPE